MSKSPDAFRTISEVAEWLGVQAHVLRFWESKFTQVKPVKRAGGRRYYRPADMQLIGGIKHLLHDEGLSIKEVQGILRDQGTGHVASLSQALDDDAAAAAAADLQPDPGPPPGPLPENVVEFASHPREPGPAAGQMHTDIDDIFGHWPAGSAKADPPFEDPDAGDAAATGSPPAAAPGPELQEPQPDDPQAHEALTAAPAAAPEPEAGQPEPEETAEQAPAGLEAQPDAPEQAPAFEAQEDSLPLAAGAEPAAGPEPAAAADAPAAEPGPQDGAGLLPLETPQEPDAAAVGRDSAAPGPAGMAADDADAPAAAAPAARIAAVLETAAETPAPTRPGVLARLAALPALPPHVLDAAAECAAELRALADRR